MLFQIKTLLLYHRIKNTNMKHRPIVMVRSYIWGLSYAIKPKQDSE